MSVATVSVEWRKDSGLFFGHLASGVAFVLGSFLWVLKHYYKNALRQNDGSERQPWPRSTINGIFRVIPWEGCVFVFIGCVGIFISFDNQYFRFRFIGDDGMFVLDSLRGWQHTIPSISLLLYGLLIILADTKFRKLVYYIKPVGSVTFVLFGTIFALHGTMKDPMDSKIHNILIVCGYGIAVSFALETAYPTQKLYFIMRVFFTLLQGTWFIQSAFIIDPRNGQPWDGYDKLNIMFVSTIFLFHFLCDFWVVILIFSCLVPTTFQNEERQDKYIFLQDESKMRLLKDETDLGV